MTERTEKPAVLVINDNETGRYLIARLLKPYFTVEEAATGAAGIEKSLANPDLILLDVNLPDISGFEVCRKVKKNPLTGHIPVLHLSATTLDAASRAAGLENGADGYLTLPVETDVLIATMNSLLRIKKAEAALLKALADKEREERLNRQMLMEMASMQKIESLGQLAGGIAHDFNNILAGITGNLSVLNAHNTLSEEDRAAIKDMLAASESAQRITRQLLNFARGGQPVKQVFNLGEALSSWCSFSLRGSKSKVVMSIAPGLWPVNGDEGQLNQAVNNLLRNALEAMPRGGIIRVTAENITPGGAADQGPPAANHIRLTVADNGAGIPAKNLGRLFEPYFTTKAQGHGLGLPMAYSIIKNHGGEMKALSEPGSGAEFTILLPAAAAGVRPRRKAAAEALKGSGRVLVMDDEEIVRKAVRRMLIFLGYECVCATDGEEALKLYTEAMGGPGAFKAVIMDLTIPGGLGGAEAVKRLLEADPGAKVVVSSGYGEDNAMADYAAAGFSAALLKPYEYSDLAAVLTKLIAPGSLREGPAKP
ncbi:MAG TPA: hypothetical protein DCZ92_07545 [Elusimicrobia bacterium]|nr:MAG: hypothetical protein A2016_10550 [Elusimicrobia bacterium GWF2_62_30]HBA60660.1 hypothetical protein [Elusimicrobiota bacterium]